jgi:predicted ABC-type transport system involved in lysophospholipase L1 biosynthesis ATPase subunit
MSEVNGPLVEARNVRKRYQMGARELEVLKGVDLRVNAGEFVALRGASGAGKSTLLHLLAGLDTVNGGNVFFKGGDLTSLSGMDLARWRNLKVGLVFQSYHLFPELNALENVCLPARMARTSPGKAVDRAKELLRRVGLAQRETHRPAELSGGEQQRVAIARALINEPELLLADEPTGNLDSHTGDEIMSLLLDLRSERNTTLIIATHDAALAGRAPRVVQLVDGQIASA